MDDTRRFEPYTQDLASLSISPPHLNNYSADKTRNSTSSLQDWRHQRRGRNLEQFERVIFSSEDERSGQNDHYEQRYPIREHRRARSAESRPHYHNSTTNEYLYDSSSPYNTSSYREGLHLSSSIAYSDSKRSHSDAGIDVGTDAFRFYQLPRYEAVVHDDSILYSSTERKQYRGNIDISRERKQASKSFQAGENGTPDNSLATAGRPSYNKDDRIEFVYRQHPIATRNATASAMLGHHQQQHLNQSMYEQERQYYDFAKENLITFGGCDAPTASTGLSQEELLQRKRRGDTREKRKEKRRNRTNKDRILNFPSTLLKASTLQQKNFSKHNHQQNQSSLSNYKKMASFTLENNNRGENVYDGSGDSLDANGYIRRGSGIRGSTVRRQRNKSKSYQNGASRVSANNGTNDCKVNYTESNRSLNQSKVTNSYEPSCEIALDSSIQKDNFDGFMDEPNLFPGDATNILVNDPRRCYTDYDYLSVQRGLDQSTRKETKSRSGRPTHAGFTPRFEYTPRHLSVSTHQAHNKNSSPTSVTDQRISNSGCVRWNENLTQQEFIVTPQSTKLRPETDEKQWRNVAHKPKSILRSRRSSSYVPNIQIKDKTLNYSNERPSDEHPERQSESARFGKGMAPVSDGDISIENTGNDPYFSTIMSCVDGHGRHVSPVGTDQLYDTNSKFPESYVQFIEAVASVVIQTKVRQKLAKQKVQELRNDFFTRNKSFRFPVSKMNPMGRKPNTLTRKVRQRNEVKKSEGRKNVALDFYALAAIQIQAAFRGWWVRDCLGVDNYCVTMIQKTYRGSRSRNDFGIDLKRIIIVQSICRRWMAIDAAVTRIYCIVRIQAISRGSLVRKRFRLDASGNNIYHAAAIMIQTLWRSFWCEMNFLRSYEDILVVQSIVRGWIARRNFRSFLTAKNTRISRQFMTNAHCKLSKPTLKSPNKSSLTHSNHIEYLRKTQSSGSRSEISAFKSSLKKASKHVLLNVERDSNVENRKYSKIDEGIKTRKKIISEPERNSVKHEHGSLPYDKFQTQAEMYNAAFTSSNSRVDVGTRRKCKEKQEMEAERKKENRRRESRAAGITEIEVQRQKMAVKAAARKKEKITTHQSCKLKKPADRLDTSDENDKKYKSDNWFSTKKSLLKSGKSNQQNPAVIRKAANELGTMSNATMSKVDSVKGDNKKGGVLKTEIHQSSIGPTPFVVTGKTKSCKLKKPADRLDTPDENPKKYKADNLFLTKKSQLKSGKSSQQNPVVIRKAANELGIISSTNMSTVDSIKGDDKKGEVLKTEIHQSSIGPTAFVATGKTKSLVFKRTPELVMSDKNGRSTGDKSISAVTNDDGDSDLELFASPSGYENLNLNVRNRNISTYQKAMQNLRSAAEQQRIDDINNIFEQAGLLFRMKV